MDKFDMLTNSQFGFRPNHSTYMPLINLIIVCTLIGLGLESEWTWSGPVHVEKWTSYVKINFYGIDVTRIPL